MVGNEKTAKATSSDAAVDVFGPVRGDGLVTIINESAVKGWYSIDGGGSWHYLPAANASSPGWVTVRALGPTVHVQVQRVAGGSNLSGIYGWLS